MQEKELINDIYAKYKDPKIYKIQNTLFFPENAGFSVFKFPDHFGYKVGKRGEKAKTRHLITRRTGREGSGIFPDPENELFLRVPAVRFLQYIYPLEKDSILLGKIFSFWARLKAVGNLHHKEHEERVPCGAWR